MSNDHDDNNNNHLQDVPVTQNKVQERNQQRAAVRNGEQEMEEEDDDDNNNDEKEGEGAEAHSEEKAVADYEQFFPARLHGLLEMLEKDGLSQICCFLPHGQAFMVRHQKQFVAELLPQWFRQTRWSSFQRQLNLYDFKRITAGPDKGAYYHRYFIRGQRELCRLIKRVRIKGTGPRKPSRPEAEPDFYHQEESHSHLPLPSQRSSSPYRAAATAAAVAAQEAGALATSRNTSRPPPTVPAVAKTPSLPLRQSLLPATQLSTTTTTTTTTSQHNGIFASPLSPAEHASLYYRHEALEAARLFLQNSIAENANVLRATDPSVVQQLLIRHFLQHGQLLLPSESTTERNVSSIADLGRLLPRVNMMMAARGSDTTTAPSATSTTYTPSSIAASRITFPSSGMTTPRSNSQNPFINNNNSNLDLVAWLREHGFL